MDHQGDPVTSGTYRVTFRIWDDATGAGAEHLVWGREFSPYVMDGGLFNVLLTDTGGTATTNPPPQTNDLLQAFSNENRFLGLTITETPAGPAGSPAEISPRQRLASAPFVFHAESAADAEQASGGFRVENGLVVASGGLEVTGAATLHDTLTVYGAVTFSDILTVNDTVLVTNHSMDAHVLHVYSGGTQIDGGVNVKGNLTVDPPSALTGHGTVPVGAIIMWSGSASEVPDGWALCNGDTHSGKATPNLCDRFVTGAGNGYALDATGGEDRHQLSISEMPEHHHSYNYKSEEKGYALAEHSDGGFWKNTDGSNTGNTGGNEAHENRPPYYALCYIMRVK